MKKIGFFLIAFVALIASFVLYLHSNLDSMVKAAIEKYGTAAVQTDVRLDSVAILITSGQASLTELTVANPKGFAASKAISMGKISVTLDTRSITGNGPIIIREVIIDKPDVDFEANLAGETNLQTLEKNIAADTHSGSNQQQGRKIVIDNLTIRGGQIGISHPLLKQLLTVGLPAIHLTNIGKNNGGDTAAQIADQILGSIITNASTAAANALVSQNISGALKGAGGNAIKNVSGLGNSINNLLGR
jgi:hypothetical protein